MPNKAKLSKKAGREARDAAHLRYKAVDRATQHKLARITRMCRKHPAYAASVRRGEAVPIRLADRVKL